MSDDEMEMAAMRSAQKYKLLQTQKQRMGNKTKNLIEKYAPKEEEDQTGFKVPKPRPPAAGKRDTPFDPSNPLPEDFGRKIYAGDPSLVHEYHERKSLSEAPPAFVEPSEEDDDLLVGPPVPEAIKESSTDPYADYVKEGFDLPITHQAILKGHNRGVVALDVDPAGNRLITGGNDYQLNIYDFQGMNEKLRPFRTFQPFEGYPITCLDFNNTGSNLLVSAGKNTVKVYTRDGVEVQETIKGDMYLRDMVHTKGHTETVNEAHWNPIQKNLFMTISYDGTIRLWDLMSKHIGLDQNITHQHLMKLKAKNGMKSAGNTCCYSSDAELLMGGTRDGGIHIWHNKSYFTTPDFVNLSAHPGAEISSLCFTQDSLQLFSRATDHTLKLWDLRKFQTPLHVWSDLPNDSSRAQVSLSPDGKLVATASTIVNPHNPKSTVGRVIFCDTTTFDVVARVNICHSPVYRVHWQGGINQIIIGCGDGGTRVMYDPKTSTKGVTLALGKKAKTSIEDHIEYQRPIVTLDTVHLIKENKPRPIRIEEMREDSKLTKKPEEPLKGRLVSNSLTAYIMTQIHRNADRDLDAKEALLKYADAAQKNPEWVAPAYAKTQPKPVFDYSEPTREEVKFMEGIRKSKCPKCGQKFCTCNRKLGDDIDDTKSAGKKPTT